MSADVLFKNIAVSQRFQEFPGKKKAALFLTVIGSEITGEILKYLKESEIEILVMEMAKIPKVEHEERLEILQEFQRLAHSVELIKFGGVDFAKDLLEKSLGTKKASDILNRLAASIQTKPLESARKADPTMLVNYIQTEHPQTIALILSYLKPQNAALVLSMLPVDLRADVTRRIANMDRTYPEILKEVEKILERQIHSDSNEDFTAAGGIEAIVSILNLSDRATEKRIIEELEENDPELAEEIKKRMFLFEDIVLLDDRSIQKVLREIETNELAKALKAVDTEVQEKIYRNMSKRAGALLREDMEYMGPIRLKDVEESQQRVVGVIRKLEEQGEIIIARGNEDQVVV